MSTIMNASRIQLAPAFRKVETLQRRLESQPDALVREAVRELLRALEELRLAQGHLLAQRDEAESLRGELGAEHQKYLQLFDAAPDAYVITDADLTIISANRAAAGLFNISQRFMTGKGLSVFVSKDRGRFVADAGRLALTGGSAQWSFGIRPRERAAVHVDARVFTHASQDGLELHWLMRLIS
jgi:PAS domain-containing protein